MRREGLDTDEDGNRDPNGVLTAGFEFPIVAPGFERRGMSKVETFKRGQVQLALWRLFSRTGPMPQRPDDVPKTFATRVRKFGEFGIPLEKEERPNQPGVDIDYTVYQAFELGVALDMQDNGLNQAEIGFFLRNVRRRLREVHERILASPPAGREVVPAKDRPLSPARPYIKGADPAGLGDPSRADEADTSVFMAFRYVEVQEAWPELAFDASDWEGKGRHPLFLEPRFHFGLGSLMSEMARLAESGKDRIRTVIELSNMAVDLLEALRSAPPTRRGRP